MLHPRPMSLFHFFERQVAIGFGFDHRQRAIAAAVQSWNCVEQTACVLVCGRVEDLPRAAGFDELTAIGILSAIFGLRDRRDASGRSAKQIHMAVALARRMELANAQVPAAA